MNLRPLALAALLAAAPLWAQTPSDESIKQLLDLANTNQMVMESAKIAFQHEQTALMGQLTAKYKLSPAQQQQLIGKFSKFNNEFQAEMQRPETIAQVRALITPIVKKHFTQEEIDFQIRQLSDPIGQQIVRKQPAYLQDISVAAMQYAPQLAKHLQTQINEFTNGIEKFIRSARPQPKTRKKAQ